MSTKKLFFLLIFFLVTYTFPSIKSQCTNNLKRRSSNTSQTSIVDYQKTNNVPEFKSCN